MWPRNRSVQTLSGSSLTRGSSTTRGQARQNFLGNGRHSVPVGEGLRVRVGRDLQGGVDVAVRLELDDVAAGVGDLGLGLLGGLPLVIRRDRDQPRNTARVQTSHHRVEFVATERDAEVTRAPYLQRGHLVGTVLQRELQ